MNIGMKLLIIFMAIWIGGEVGQSTYAQKLGYAIWFTLIFAYFENVHGILWKKLKHKLKS